MTTWMFWAFICLGLGQLAHAWPANGHRLQLRTILGTAESIDEPGLSSSEELRSISNNDEADDDDNQTSGRGHGSYEYSTSLPPAIIAFIVISLMLCFVACLSCYMHSQQRQRHVHVSCINSNPTSITSSHQLQALRGSVRVIYMRSMNNVGVAPQSQVFPSIYEAPPPSYEVATGNLPSIHQSPPPPPVTAHVE
ncbi:unnamed protein product [Rotaria sordida]|uniref:Uncharacterized protein n=1 Tax=Rotaria sordida TaxID=392033 RepID=A0A814BXS0_9BILA|nr:unnamed protein product [Rotaria sordida]CAF3642313.1 unnamed protein product [Rotaria sordida]